MATNNKGAAAHRANVAARYAAGESAQQIGDSLGVTRQAIVGMIRRQGIPMPHPNAKTTAAQKVEIVERYVAGGRASAPAAAFNVSEPTVRMLLLRRGVTLRQHHLWHEAFDELTPNATYWIGFLFADGTVSVRPGLRPHIGLGLAGRDSRHLEELRAFLRSTGSISMRAALDVTDSGRTRGPTCQFSVRSDRLAARLLDLGRYAGAVNAELAASRHFWRGVVDGDGSIGAYPTASSTSPHLKAQIRLCGERRLLESFAAFLTSQGMARLSVRPHKSIWNIGTTGVSAERIIALLYHDAPTALARKAEAAARIASARDIIIQRGYL